MVAVCKMHRREKKFVQDMIEEPEVKVSVGKVRDIFEDSI
jgi:hypothetical protein